MNIDSISSLVGKTIYVKPFVVVTIDDGNKTYQAKEDNGGYSVIGFRNATDGTNAKIQLKIQDEPGLDNTYIDYIDNQYTDSLDNTDYYVLSDTGWHAVTNPTVVNNFVNGISNTFGKLTGLFSKVGAYGIIGIVAAVGLWIFFKFFKKGKK